MQIQAHRILLIGGLAISLLVHGVMAVLLYLSASAQPQVANAHGSIEMDVAPAAPAAHTPGAESDEPTMPDLPATADEPATPDEPIAPEPAAGGTIQAEPDEPDEPDQKQKVALGPDAGVPDGGPAIATALDAGVAEPDDAGAVLAATEDAGSGDGGAAVASTDTLPGDGGLNSAGDAGPSVAGGSSGTDPVGDPNAPPAPTGADTNLLSYFAPNQRVGLLVRLDRFRGTPWAPRVEKMFRPMPDYGALMSGRKGMIADYFDSLILSSDSPQDPTATTVICRYPATRTPAKVRSFLDRPSTRVRWRASRAGALGMREKSRVVTKQDQRVYLMPVPNLVFLIPPPLIGALASTTTTAIDVFPQQDALPAWMHRVATIEQESGQDDGPEVLVTFANKKKTFSIPFLGSSVAPERITVTLDVHKQGFILRGNLVFDSARSAAIFVTWALSKQKSLTESYGGKLLLARVKAYNALKGLTLNTAGAKVAFATSISVADGMALVDNATVLVENRFNQNAEDATKAGPKPRTEPARRPRRRPKKTHSKPSDGPTP